MKRSMLTVAGLSLMASFSAQSATCVDYIKADAVFESSFRKFVNTWIAEGKTPAFGPDSPLVKPWNKRWLPILRAYADAYINTYTELMGISEQDAEVIGNLKLWSLAVNQRIVYCGGGHNWHPDNIIEAQRASIEKLNYVVHSTFVSHHHADLDRAVPS